MIDAFNRQDPGGLVTNLTNPQYGQYTGTSLGSISCRLGCKITF